MAEVASFRICALLA